MGYHFVTLDPMPDCPAAQVSDRQIVAPYTDVAAAAELAQLSDVITYEFENVDLKVARFLEEHAYVPQGSQLLAIAQHRVREKSTLQGFGIPVTPFRPIDSLGALYEAADTLGLPLVVKTCMGGYDGKGQWVVEAKEDLPRCFAQAEEVIASGAAAASGQAPLIAEALVDLACEVSVIAARSPSGEIRTFPVAENVHRHHILHLSMVPARVPKAIVHAAEDIAKKTAEALQVVGLIAVEMFVTRGGSLLVNELAPRPHNSGHYTYDACMTSQFEQHVRAICDLPLGDVHLWSPVVMVNVLGEHLEGAINASPHLRDTMKLHLYGKRDARPGRKMGHLTALSASVDDALLQIEALGIWQMDGMRHP